MLLIIWETHSQQTKGQFSPRVMYKMLEHTGMYPYIFTSKYILWFSKAKIVLSRILYGCECIFLFFLFLCSYSLSFVLVLTAHNGDAVMRHTWQHIITFWRAAWTWQSRLQLNASHGPVPRPLGLLVEMEFISFSLLLLSIPWKQSKKKNPSWLLGMLTHLIE